MNELHLFAGAGGGILGGQLLGHTCVCAVELEEYCQQVLLQRQQDGIFPHFPIWDDVCTFDGRPWRGIVDIICGGFPCQDISSAGKGAGITGERSGLWSEFARIIREVQPAFVFVENSPMLTSRGLDVVLGDLAKMGYNARWGVFGADDIGADHHRKRIWILAYGPKLLANTNSERLEGISEESVLGINDIQRESMRSGTDFSKVWATEPRLDRVVNGMAGRGKRLKAIGNGQVPAVAAYAFTRLMNARLNPCNAR